MYPPLVFNSHKKVEMPCFLGGVGGGGNRTRVHNNFHFKSFTGLDYFFKQSNRLSGSRCVTSINNSGVYLSAEPPAYSLLGNEVSEDPANYAARAIEWN